MHLNIAALHGVDVTHLGGGEGQGKGQGCGGGREEGGSMLAL